MLIRKQEQHHRKLTYEEEFLAFLRTLDGVRVDVTATQIRVSKK